MNTANFKYKEITSGILNAAFEVYNTLGCGFLEKVYENALIYELKQRGLKVTSQKEIKAVDAISTIHEAQLLNYLNASRYHVGLILNFAKTKLEYKRLVM